MNNYFRAFCTVLFIGMISGCAEYPAYEITHPPFVNKTSLEMYIGDEVQLTASPAGGNFTWSSENKEIVDVSQTGLVKAVGEGLSSISVASAGDETKIDVRVSIFIPLTGISLPKKSLRLYAGDNAQIWAYPVPENASDVTFTWTSENPDVAIVDRSGIVTAVSRGITKVIVAYGSVSDTVVISVPELYQCNKSGWTVEVSDQTASDGGGKDRMIDGDYSNSGYWHSQWGPDVLLPHWAVIDMKTEVEVARLVTQRRNNGDTKTLQYFVGDSPDANSGTWVKIVEGAFPSTAAPHSITLDAAEPTRGRYLKLVLTESNRAPFTAICEIDVYGLMY